MVDPVTWTYTGNPTASDIDAVRFLIQDTDDCDPQLQDEEITWQLGVDGTVTATAVACCRVLAARYARKATSKQVGDLRLQWDDRSKRYLDLARELETRGAAIIVGGRAGGVLVADKDAAARDTERTQPAFYRGVHDDPRAPGNDIAALWGVDWST